MSTRCNIIIKDKYDQIIFYRHSDGYPDGVRDTLSEFLDFVKKGKIRDNAQQSAGWLIILGYTEYLDSDRENGLANLRKEDSKDPRGMLWKVGAYEPCSGIHGDIEYLYEINLESKTLRGWRHNGERKGKEITDELNPPKAD